MNTQREAIDEALADAREDDDVARVVICRGRPLCDRTDGRTCDWCYVVRGDDPRSADQIIADMDLDQH